jgi:DNA-binding CsgD family transcriptional regulator
MVEQRVAGSDSSRIVWSSVDGEALLLDTSSGDYFSLNPLGTEIWLYLQQGNSPAEIVEAIAKKYMVGEETVYNDVTALLDDLRAARILD